jgi:hypothetical protein
MRLFVLPAGPDAPLAIGLTAAGKLLWGPHPIATATAVTSFKVCVVPSASHLRGADAHPEADASCHVPSQQSAARLQAGP